MPPPPEEGAEIEPLAPRGKGLEKLFHLFVLCQQLIDHLDGGPRSHGDTPAPRSLDDFRVEPFRARHGLNDGLVAANDRVVHLGGIHPLDAAEPGHHLHHLAQGPHLLDLLELKQQGLQGEVPVLKK